ncbi:MAG TPA: hypothetical protein VF487_02005 [Chitinophagaceae bacterium]
MKFDIPIQTKTIVMANPAQNKKEEKDKKKTGLKADPETLHKTDPQNKRTGRRIKIHRLYSFLWICRSPILQSFL